MSGIRGCNSFFLDKGKILNQCVSGAPLYAKLVTPLVTINFQKTRLEILSRPKVPKILQELLRNSKELPRPRPTKLLKNSKRFQKNTKRLQKDSKYSKRLQKNPKDSKRFQLIPKDSKRF